jgi:hypothetical protein
MLDIASRRQVFVLSLDFFCLHLFIFFCVVFLSGSIALLTQLKLVPLLFIFLFIFFLLASKCLGCAGVCLLVSTNVHTHSLVPHKCAH